MSVNRLKKYNTIDNVMPTAVGELVEVMERAPARRCSCTNERFSACIDLEKIES